MKILFLTNSREAETLANWISATDKDDQVIIESNNISVLDFKYHNPDLVISYSYQYILNADILQLVSRPIINLHISYLPFNRGANPNVWSFLDDTKKGVTIHEIDTGIDTGPILLQKEIHFPGRSLTLRETYGILQNEIQKLFKKNWNDIKNGNINACSQKEKGSYHSISEFKKIEKYILRDDEWDVTLEELISRYKDIERTKDENL
jgi:methionyl-tRNA formyltransferase